MVYGESCICLKGLQGWELEKITIVAFAEYRKPSSISYHRRTFGGAYTNNLPPDEVPRLDVCH